ncbi:hypothetical protein JQC92_05395 [Shewanella sp. 202IG2-18]|uniref:hypothetical protein n=1 Tax=Parashewanella hymeniacidonis TaxID=2807618 RepID=UPI001961CDF0|nr:hypothetical protein [Parashewanella hymeniacidonis]MBM7071472.1 hypothetical protein [Parashewanella hymeniacidonis]
MRLALGLLLSIVSFLGQAEALPPMSFGSSFNHEELYDILKDKPLFKNMDSELIGAPIRLEISHTFKATAGGNAAGLASAMWAGMSLGILPVVTNRDLVIRYEVFVKGHPVSNHEFSENFTEAINMYSVQNSFKLDGKPYEWVKSTIPQALKLIEEDEKVKELQREYEFYFGEK